MEPAHKRSREKRSSKRSLRSSVGSSIDAGKSNISNAAAERRLQMVLETEQQELIIYSIREELMQRVMEECQKKYMEKQCVNFTVHCAYRALVRLVNLGLFHHDAGKPFYTGHPSWLNDKPPEPSPADSWAVSQVAIKPKPIPKPITPPDEDTPQPVEEEELENVFTGIERPEQESSAEEQKDVEVIYQNVEEAGEFESEVQLAGPPVTEVTLSVEEEQSISAGSVHPVSIFTQTTEMPKEYLPHSMKSARSKIKGLITKIKEDPVLNMEEISSVKSRLSVSVFSALRSDAKYKKKPETKEGENELEQMASDPEE